jgi:serine protease inhibitor
LDPPAPLVADRAFVFVIHDVEQGTPAFLGRIVDPR